MLSDGKLKDLVVRHLRLIDLKQVHRVMSSAAKPMGDVGTDRDIDEEAHVVDSGGEDLLARQPSSIR